MCKINLFVNFYPTNVVCRYKNLIRIEGALLDDTEAMDKLRVELLKDMGQLQSIGTQSLVNEAVDCHLRTIVTNESKEQAK